MHVASPVLTYILFEVFNVLMHFFVLFFFVFCPGNVYFATLSILQNAIKHRARKVQRCIRVYTAVII